MSRLEVIYQTTADAVRLIHRLGNEELISPDLQYHLNEDDHDQVIYHCKNEDVTPRLEKAVSEAEKTKELMADDCWQEFSEYQLLLRVLEEQSSKDKNGTIRPKEKGEISPSSLQNPSDSDATFRSKAGGSHKSYVSNIVDLMIVFEMEGDTMLKIIFGETAGAVYHPPTYFDNRYEDEWITDPLSVFRKSGSKRDCC